MPNAGFCEVLPICALRFRPRLNGAAKTRQEGSRRARIVSVDESLLASALARPRQLFAYAHAKIESVPKCGLSMRQAPHASFRPLSNAS